METVTVSPKFQVVIPKSIRERMALTPGETLTVYVEDGVIRMLRVPPIQKLRGFLKGISTVIEREPDREL